jgi:hypothetical protein
MGRFQPGQFDDLSQKAIEDALKGEPAYDVSPEATAEYFRRGVANPMMREFDEMIKPRINESFAAQGALFNTRRSESLVKALENAQEDLSSELAKAQMRNMTLEAQLAENAAQRQQQAVGQAESFENKPLRQSMAQQQAASGFQQHEQQKADADYQEFLRTRPAYSPWPQLALGYLSNPEIALQQKSGSSGFGGMLSGALSGAGTGAAIGSVVPVIGTALGAGLGAVVGGGASALSGGSGGGQMVQRAAAPYLMTQMMGGSGPSTPRPGSNWTKKEGAWYNKSGTQVRR